MASITGYITLTLKEGTSVDAFVQELKEDYEYELHDITIEDNTINFYYDSKYSETAEEIMDKDEVVDFEGSFEDNGYDSGECGTFSLKKKDGKILDAESPVYLSELSNDDLVSELEKRGFKVTLKELTKPKDIERE